MSRKFKSGAEVALAVLGYILAIPLVILSNVAILHNVWNGVVVDVVNAAVPVTYWQAFVVMLGVGFLKFVWTAPKEDERTSLSMPIITVTSLLVAALSFLFV